MKTIKPLLFAATVILILFSCRKKDHHPPEQEKKILLTKYTAATFVRTYSYDENNRATGYVNSESNPANDYTITYTYNSSGQVADVHYDNPGSANDFKNSYFYNSNGQITKIETYLLGDGIATFESKTEADYSTPGKISSYYTPNGGLPKLVTEFYVDSKGNITRQLSYSTEGFLLVTTENADFDDKHSPTASLPQTTNASPTLSGRTSN